MIDLFSLRTSLVTCHRSLLFVHREQQLELLDPRRALDLVNAGDAAGDLGTPVITQRLFRFEQVNADIIARRRFARIIFLDQSRNRPEERQSLFQIPNDFIMTQAAMELYEQDVHRIELTRYAPSPS